MKKEISIKTNHQDAELISAAMFMAGADGVEIDDKQDVIDVLSSSKNWDYVDDDVMNVGDEVFVKTVLEGDETSFLDSLKSALKTLNISVSIDVNKIDDVDWTKEWKKYFKPVHTSSVTVVPSWIEYDKAEGEKISLIEPGHAFGTGEHETTKMCLDMMGDVKGKDIIDVGCGSGILGIAAKICGAKSAYLCDIDSMCVESSVRHAILNKVDVTVEERDLLSDKDVYGDLVFANLTADILLKLSDGICDHISDGGYLIISGIIDSREEEVLTRYLDLGLKLVDKMSMKDWRAFKFQKQ